MVPPPLRLHIMFLYAVDSYRLTQSVYTCCTHHIHQCLTAAPTACVAAHLSAAAAVAGALGCVCGHVQRVGGVQEHGVGVEEVVVRAVVGECGVTSARGEKSSGHSETSCAGGQHNTDVYSGTTAVAAAAPSVHAATSPVHAAATSPTAAGSSVRHHAQYNAAHYGSVPVPLVEGLAGAPCDGRGALLAIVAALHFVHGSMGGGGEGGHGGPGTRYVHVWVWGDGLCKRVGRARGCDLH